MKNIHKNNTAQKKMFAEKISQLFSYIDLNFNTGSMYEECMTIKEKVKRTQFKHQYAK